MDKLAVSKTSFHDLVASRDKETMQYLRDAAQSKGNVSQYILSCTVALHLYCLSYFSTCSLTLMEYLYFTEGSLGHTLSILKSVDHLVGKNAEKLSTKLQLKVQELLHKKYSYTDEGVLPKDQIQKLLVGSKHIVDFALSLELQVVCLEQHTLQIFNFVVVGGACGHLLDILEFCLWLPRVRGKSNARLAPGNIPSIFSLKWPP